MENKIEINGVWYVREDTIQDQLDYPEEFEIDLCFSEECCYETDKYSFIASRIRKNESDKYYPDISIEFVDKRSGNVDTWIKEYWDNNNWFKGILQGDPESIESLNGETPLCKKGKRQFKQFLKRLVEEEWIISTGETE